MQARRMPRYGTGFRVIGAVLVIGSIGVLALTALWVLLALDKNRTTPDLELLRRRTASRLLDIRDVPREAAERFESTGWFDTRALARLTTGDQATVRWILADYEREAARLGAAPGEVFNAGCGLASVSVIALPLLILGALLLRSRACWWCPVCGYLFERA